MCCVVITCFVVNLFFSRTREFQEEAHRDMDKAVDAFDYISVAGQLNSAVPKTVFGKFTASCL